MGKKKREKKGHNGGVKSSTVNWKCADQSTKPPSGVNESDRDEKRERE